MAVFYNREKGKHGSLTGTIINFPKRIVSDDPASSVNMELIPPGYLTCDGRILSATDYPMLAMVLGVGDECKFKKEGQALSDTQFQLPDLRMKHIRATSSANIGQYVDLVVTNKNVDPERDVIKSGVGLDVIQNIPSPYELTYDGSFYIPPQELPLVGEPRFAVDSGNYTYYAEVSEKQYQPHMHRSNTFRARQFDKNGNHFSGRQTNSTNTKSSLSVCLWWAVAEQDACYWYWTGLSTQHSSNRPGHNGAPANYYNSYGACWNGVCNSFVTQQYCLWPDEVTCPNMALENEYVQVILDDGGQGSRKCNHTNKDPAQEPAGNFTNIFGEHTLPSNTNVYYEPTFTTECICRNIPLIGWCWNGTDGPTVIDPFSKTAETDLQQYDKPKNLPFAPYDENVTISPTAVQNITSDTGLTGDSNNHRHILEMDTDEPHTYVMRTRASSARADTGLQSSITISKNDEPKADKYIQPYIVQEYLIKT